jgi:hypothetical protein
MVGLFCGVAGFVEEAFAEEPQADGDGEPDEGGEREDDPRAGSGEPDPEDECEGGQGDAADRGAVGVNGSDDAAAIGAVVARSALVLFLVGFDEAGAGGEDGGKGKEEASDHRTVVLCDEAGGDADGPAEDEADDPLVRFDSFDGGEAGSDEHGLPDHQEQSERHREPNRNQRNGCGEGAGFVAPE